MSISNQLVNKQYNKISFQTRKQLVAEVIDDQRSLAKTASKLGIKLSTAKSIIKRFKDQGTFFQTKKGKKERCLEEKKLQQEDIRQQEVRKALNESISNKEILPLQPVYSQMSLPYPFSFHFYNLQGAVMNPTIWFNAY